jgi:hypothetical protein
VVRSYDNLYCSPHIIKAIESMRTRWAGHGARIGEIRNAYKALVGTLEGKRPYWGRRRAQDCNVNIYLKEIGLDDVEWIHSCSG